MRAEIRNQVLFIKRIRQELFNSDVACHQQQSDYQSANVLLTTVRFPLSAAQIIERSSDLVFGLQRSAFNDKSVKSPELSAPPPQKKWVFIRFLWQLPRHGHCVFFDDRRQNSIKWPRLHWDAGRQAASCPAATLTLASARPVSLMHFHHIRDIFLGRAARFPHCDCSMTRCMNCALLKGQQCVLAKTPGQEERACKFIWACKSASSSWISQRISLCQSPMFTSALYYSWFICTQWV